MSANHWARLATLVLIVGAPLPAAHAEPEDGAGMYSLSATVGGGVSYYPLTPGAAPPGVPTELSRLGGAGTVRVMWNPDHAIRFGIETGWSKLYSYEVGGSPSGEVSLSSIPLLTVVSMHVLGVDLFVGWGYHLLTSHLEYEGTVDVQTWSLGWMLAASHVRPVSETLGMGLELKWLNPSEHEEAALSLQVQLVWTFLEW